MQANEYQKQAARTLIDGPDFELTEEEYGIVWSAIILMRSIGSLLEYIKKTAFHRQEKIDTNNVSIAVNTIRLLAEYFFNDLPATYYDKLTKKEFMQLWALIGLGGEVGEVFNLFDDKLRSQSETTKEEIGNELGDVSWYLAALAAKSDLKLSGIMQQNIDKLKERYPDGYNSEDSKHN
jgi:NTP pyrophosphatase (non-canonical NTP hydrolase)